MSRNKTKKTFVFLLIPLSVFAFGFRVLCFAGGQYLYDDKGKRNPFFPLVTPDGRIIDLDKKEDESQLRLDGIIYSAQAISYAIINQQVVKAGDWVGKYRVDRIEKNRVLLSDSGEELELILD